MSGQNPFEQRISVLYRLWWPRRGAANWGTRTRTLTGTHRTTPHGAARTALHLLPHRTTGPGITLRRYEEAALPPHPGLVTARRTKCTTCAGGGTVTNTSAGREVRYHGIIPHQYRQAPRAVAAMCRSHGHCHHRHYYHHRHHRPLSCCTATSSRNGWATEEHDHACGGIPHHQCKQAARVVAATCRSHGHYRYHHCYHHHHHRRSTCCTANKPVGVTAAGPRSTTTLVAAYPTTSVSKPRVW